MSESKKFSGSEHGVPVLSRILNASEGPGVEDMNVESYKELSEAALEDTAILCVRLLASRFVREKNGAKPGWLSEPEFPGFDAFLERVRDAKTTGAKDEVLGRFVKMLDSADESYEILAESDFTHYDNPTLFSTAAGCLYLLIVREIAKRRDTVARVLTPGGGGASTDPAAQ